MKAVACHNCGLPSDCAYSSGRNVILEVAPDDHYGRKRSSKKTVWCCSGECATQTMAISKYGPSTHKWPITLAQFRAMNPLPPISGQTVTETISETSINSGVAEGLEAKIDLRDIEGVSVTPPAPITRNGRPRKWHSDAEGNRQRQRAYRQRRRGAMSQ